MHVNLICWGSLCNVGSAGCDFGDTGFSNSSTNGRQGPLPYLIEM